MDSHSITPDDMHDILKVNIAFHNMDIQKQKKVVSEAIELYNVMLDSAQRFLQEQLDTYGDIVDTIMEGLSVLSGQKIVPSTIDWKTINETEAG